MMLAALAPELIGPILLAGSPLSYWAGVAGKNPMRYMGGLLGGSWLASLVGDLGHGKFDGAYLVNNFESLEPGEHLLEEATTTCTPRSTPSRRASWSSRRWWGGHFLMNKEEMEWIVQNLFVGNKLAAGEVHPSTASTASTCATSARRSSCSRRGATTSRRRSRR